MFRARTGVKMSKQCGSQKELYTRIRVVEAKSLKKEEERSPILIGYFVSLSCLTIDLLTKKVQNFSFIGA
jgi:hypothetical protein